jgi:hypothetical protein
MTDLQPHRHRPDAPLTAGARFIRGFTRIGAIVAVLVALGGLALSIMIATDRYTSEANGHQSAQCIARLARSGYTFKEKEYSAALDYSVGGCNGWYHSNESIKEVIAIADSPAPILDK